MRLNTVKPGAGAKTAPKRLGRGIGTGLGKTCGRGHKGQRARAGGYHKVGFEGGQMPMQRRLPKFGFNNINRVEYKALNLDAIQALVDKTNATVVTLELIRENGLCAKKDLVKILNRGEITSAVEVQANGFSASAIAAIEKAGGKAVTL